MLWKSLRTLCDDVNEISAGIVVELAGAQVVVGCLAIGKQDESAWRRGGAGAAKHGDGNVQLPFTVKIILHIFRCFCTGCDIARSVHNYVHLPPAVCIWRHFSPHRSRCQYARVSVSYWQVDSKRAP